MVITIPRHTAVNDNYIRHICYSVTPCRPEPAISVCCCGVQLPSDAEVIMATLKMKRQEQTAVPLPPSTYAEDVATITRQAGWPACRHTVTSSVLSHTAMFQQQALMF